MQRPPVTVFVAESVLKPLIKRPRKKGKGKSCGGCTKETPFLWIIEGIR
jgi:hypothetical protein